MPAAPRKTSPAVLALEEGEVGEGQGTIGQLRLLERMNSGYLGSKLPNSEKRGKEGVLEGRKKKWEKGGKEEEGRKEGRKDVVIKCFSFFPPGFQQDL